MVVGSTLMTATRPKIRRLMALGLTLLLAIAAYLAPGAALSQSVPEWTVAVGGDGDEFAHAVAVTPDGGSVIAGETRSFGAGFHDGWLSKLDSNGVQQWARTFGGAENDTLYSVQTTSDGGFILAGETHSLGGSTAASSVFWLIRTNATGEQLWQRTYPAIEPDAAGNLNGSGIARVVRQTADGGFVLGGSSTGPTGTVARLVRTDDEGSLLWARDLSEMPDSVAFDLVVTPGGLAVAGRVNTRDRGSDGFLLATDNDGNPQWFSTFGGGFNDEARSLVMTDEGDFALAGFTWSEGAGQSDFWLLKADASGQQLWERTFGGVLRDSAHSILATVDGGFALAGWSESFQSGDRLWVVKTDREGRLQWSSSHRSLEAGAWVSSGARAIQAASNGGFVTVGWTGTVAGARDILAVNFRPAPPGQLRPSGAVVALRNAGDASITTAAVGFNNVYQGRPLRFWFEGRLIDRDNPLPTGAVACTQPLPQLSDESVLSLDQVGSFDTLFLGDLSGADGRRAEIDGSHIEFYFNVGSGSLAGHFEVLSRSPCQQGSRVLPEGPDAPTGLSGIASDVHPGTITLGWDDSDQADIFGYAVYESRSRTGPFLRRAWLLSESSYADGGLTDGSSYYYAVSAIDSLGLESPRSEVLRVSSRDFQPPEPPTGLQAVAIDQVDGTAWVTWRPSTSADISGYRIYRQGEAGTRIPITALILTNSYEDRTLQVQGIFSYSVTAVDLAGNESDWSNIAPPLPDFFGLVLDIRRSFTGGGTLAVGTSRGRVDVETDQATEVRVPNRPNADLGDLAVGDKVAVSLRRSLGDSVAREIHLVPAKTRNRHLSGRVVSYTQDEIVIQPHEVGSQPVTFQVSETVRITHHSGAPGLGTGRFVIVSFIATEGQRAGALTEINVIPGLEPEQSPGRPEDSQNVAVIRGIFQGINPGTASLILSSTEVALDVYTVMATGLSAGDPVLVEAELRADGSLLAREVQHDRGVGLTPARTVLRGVYEGRVSDTGQWRVSGALVTVDSGTHADALPSIGQRVVVTAIQREEGVLYAREIENWPDLVNLDAEHWVSIEGLFRGITPEGTWNVGGIPVVVDANTALSGRPSVGRQVTVSATAAGSGLLATEVSGAPIDQSGPERGVSIRGVVDQIVVDEFLVVDGLQILVSDLTKTVGQIEAGANVRVKAELLLNGELLAREVALSASYDLSGEPKSNPVDIEGRIERLDADGSLLVNGIPVTVSALTIVDAALQVGAPVQVRGLLQLDGTVLAREIVGYGPSVTGGREASVAGVVDRIITGSDGRTSGFVIGDINIAIDRLTRMEAELTVGVSVIAEAIVINGEILAVTVEPRQTGSVGVLPLVQMQGVVESVSNPEAIRPADIQVNAITVLIADNTVIRGQMQTGSVVRVKGSVTAGLFHAFEIDVVRTIRPESETGQTRFEFTGKLMEVLLDEAGAPQTIRLDGNTITIVPLTVFVEQVGPGDRVSVEGINRDGELIAALVGLADDTGVQDEN